jgi:two-component system, NtrC family, response regulator PilR
MKVLAVDDDAKELARLTTVLESDGYQTTEAQSFESARQLLRERRFDLLITKVRLREYNGLHLVLHSRMFYPNTASVVVSDGPGDLNEHEAAALGAGVVVDPTEPGHVRAVVASAIEDRLLRAEPSTHA